MAYIVMAYKVMAYIVMAILRNTLCGVSQQLYVHTYGASIHWRQTNDEVLGALERHRELCNGGQPQGQDLPSARAVIKEAITT